MKRFIFCMIILLSLFSLETMAQSCPARPSIEKSSLVGNWEGTYSIDGETFPLKVKVDLEQDVLNASMALPDLDIKKSDFNTWICSSNEVHMRLDLGDGRAVKLIGVPKGNEWTGRFVHSKEANVCGAKANKFTLKKVSPNRA